jgi:predicted DNA-binding protein
MSKSAAFALSEANYKKLQAAAKHQHQTVSAFIKERIWPHVDRITEEIENGEETADLIRKEYKAGGVTKADLCLLYNKTREEIATILRGP